MASGSKSPKHVRALRRMRPVLTRELPDVAMLLNRPELKQHFTGYEANTILSPSLPSQRAEKFIEVVEFKSYDVYQKFVSVLKELRTDLAIRLEGMEREVSAASTASAPGSNGSSPTHILSNGHMDDDMMVPVQDSYRHGHLQVEQRRVRQNGGGREDAGVYGLSGTATNNFHHLRDLSYAGREFLAGHLNSDINVFSQFCDALGAEPRLIQAASRSRNPTAYLIQRHAELDDGATFQRLESALDEVGKGDLYVDLFDKLTNGGFDDDDCN